MTELILCTLALAPAITVAGMAPDGAYVTLDLGRAAHGAVPSAVTLDLDEAATALGRDAVDASELTLVAECPGGLEPVAWQCDAAGTQAYLAFVVPTGASRLRVYPARDPAFAPLRPGSVVEVTEENGRVSVRNEHYGVTHDRRTGGGLPSRIEFVGTGKVFEGFALNDRLHSAARGGFLLRNDAAPVVEVLRRGPLCVTVRVSASYIGPSGGTASNARAVYDFHYFAGSPVVVAEATVTQDTATSWDECHFLEINWPDDAFSEWATDRSPKPTPFAADSKSYDGHGWAAAVDGESVLGLFWPGRVLVHDGRGGYGTYLHGPWVVWSSMATSFRACLYIGSPADGVAAVARAGADSTSKWAVRVSSSVIEQLAADVAASGDRRAAWAVALALRESGAGRVGAATESLRRIIAARDRGDDPINAAGTGAPLFALSSDRIGIALRVADGGASLLSLYDVRSQREFLAREQPLWRAEFRDQQRKIIAVDSQQGFGRPSVSDENGSLELTWSDPDAPALSGATAVLRLRLIGPRIASRLSVQAGAAAGLWSVTPLTLELGVLGEAARDDHVLAPYVSGACVRDPLSQGLQYGGTYPSGWVSMQFGAWYDPESGLYYGLHDPTASTKDISYGLDGDAVLVRFAFPAEDAGVLGNRFEQPGDTVYELFEGDWYDAGRIYREWLEVEAPWWPDADRKDTPQWLKDIAIWALGGGAPGECVDAVKAMAAYMEVPVAFHWYNWHEIPFDVSYPHYFPTKPGVADGVRELQQAGVRVMPYINGRLWDTALEDFQTTGIAAATKDEDGAPYTEEYGSGAKLAPMCPTQELWRDTVIGLVMRLCGPEVGVDGVYIDQIAAAQPRLCFDRSHGHPLAGGHWWTVGGYWPMLRHLRAELAELDRDKMITTECNAEPFASMMDAYLTWHFQYANQVPLFASLYGGRLQLFSRAYGGDDQAHRMKGAQSLVWGEQIGWMAPTIIEHPVNGPYFRRLAKMRYALRDFLATGSMEHPPTLSGAIPDVTADWAWGGYTPITYPAVESGAWRARDGRLAVIFANSLDEPVSFTWVLDGRYYDLTGETTLVTESATRPGPSLSTPGEVHVELGPCDVVAYIIGG